MASITTSFMIIR